MNYSGYLILSDIDDTLTLRGKPISEGNLAAIKRFQAGGGRFTLCTGRALSYFHKNIDTMYRFIPNAPVATLNGTLITSWEGEVLARTPIETDYTEPINYIIANYRAQLVEVARSEETKRLSWQEGNKTDKLVGNERGETIGLDEFIDLSIPVYKFIFVLDTEEHTVALMNDMISRYGDLYDFDRSSPTLLEMHGKGTGKGGCVRIYRELLPDVHTVIAAGDYENDISMLREADVGCAMGNAIPAVKAVADRVICRAEEDGIAYIVDRIIPELEKERKQNGQV